MLGFIATMATSYVVKGIASVITNNNPVSGISDGFQAIAKTRVGEASGSQLFMLL